MSRNLNQYDSSFKYRMELQYDGTGLYGWAKQPGLPTVESSLEKALATVLGYVPQMRVAGRTDAGVHARKQVVSLHLPVDLTEHKKAGLKIDRVDCRDNLHHDSASKGSAFHRFLTSLNALTPPGITVSNLSPADDDFDARRDALSRSYRYYVSGADFLSPFWRNYCWWLPGNSGGLDLQAMQEASALVLGRHDFTAFTPTVSKHSFFHRLVLRCEWTKNQEDLLVFQIEADAFLRHMVRTLVGTMVEIGQGKRTVDNFSYLLQGSSQNVTREEAGRSAPAQGLFLWDVRYP